MKPTCSNHQMNELEMVFELVKRALADKAGGVVFNRGEEIESRLSYKEAAVIMKSLSVYFATKGCYSLSICKTCTKWNPRACSNPDFGLCCMDKLKYAYETCQNHSKNKETWGL